MLGEVWRGRGGGESLVIQETGINLGGNYNFPALAYMDLHVQQFTAQLSLCSLFFPIPAIEKRMVALGTGQVMD
jgi:hypothetical protein